MVISPTLLNRADEVIELGCCPLLALSGTSLIMENVRY